MQDAPTLGVKTLSGREVARDPLQVPPRACPTFLCSCCTCRKELGRRLRRRHVAASTAARCSAKMWSPRSLRCLVTCPVQLPVNWPTSDFLTLSSCDVASKPTYTLAWQSGVGWLMLQKSASRYPRRCVGRKRREVGIVWELLPTSAVL